MNKAQASSSDSANAKQLDAPAGTSWRVKTIRVFVLASAVIIAVDTLPNSWTTMRPAKKWLNMKLGFVGLSQGDWPLFAPNPSLNNGLIEAEVVDINQQKATWKSPDWARSSVWQKFYRFRHMNYFQRVGNNRYALADLADYLHEAIPSREYAKPNLRWSESNEILPPAELVPPIVSVTLYSFEQRMILTEEDPMPKLPDTMWSNHSRYLFNREYLP